MQTGAVRARRRTTPVAARASARVHPRPARPTSSVNLRCDPAVGRRRTRRREPRRRHHLPRPRSARRLPDRRPSNRLGAIDHVCSVEGLIIDALARTRAADAGRLDEYPGVWVDVDVPASTPQDLRHRRAPGPGPHDARVRAQRRHRHALPARAHRAVRHRRPAGDVAGRGGRRRVDARRRRRRRPARRRALGRRCDRTPGRGVAARRRRSRPVGVLAWRRAGRAGQVGVGPRNGAVERCRRHVGAVDRDPQARLAAPEGRTRRGA